MKLLQSRRFWMTIIDVVVAVVGYVEAHFIPDPAMVDLVKFLIVSLQPVFILIIVAYTVDDVAALKYSGKTQ